MDPAETARIMISNTIKMSKTKLTYYQFQVREKRHLKTVYNIRFMFFFQTLTDATNNTSILRKYGSSYCMMGLYIPALLSQAYGFTPDTKKIKLVSKIGGISVGKYTETVLH